MKGALSGVGKILGGVFAVTGFVEGIKTVAGAAAQHQAEFAILKKTIQDAGASTQVLGTDIERLLEHEARLKGFHDEELASSFTRLVSVSHDSGKAFKELALAEDVARARHIDVATAALALSRAEQGSTISLSRLGIIIPKVGEAQSRLRHEHDQLVASGVKFTGQLGLQYKAQLAAAKAADAQATRVEALRVVQQRFGGTAATFAQTASGEFARFQQILHQFEVAVGGALLPSLTHTAEAFGGFLQRLTASGQAAQTAKAVVAQLSTVFHDLAAGVQLVAPPVEAVAQALAGLTRFVGVGGILAAVAAFKAVTTSVSLARRAAEQFRVVLAAGGDAAAKQALQAKTTAGQQAAAAAEAAAAAKAQAFALQGAQIEVARSTDLFALHTRALRVDAAAAVLDASAQGRLTEVFGLGAVSISAALDTVKASAETTAAASEALGKFSKLPSPDVTAQVAAQDRAAEATRIHAATQHELAQAIAASGASSTAARTEFDALSKSVDVQIATLDRDVAAKNADTGATARLGAAAGAAAEKIAASNGAVNATLAEEQVQWMRVGDAMVATAVAARDLTAANGALAASNEVVAVTTTEEAAGALARIGSSLATAGRGLLALAGGPWVAAAAAAAALAFGIYKLVTAESAFEKQTDRARKALDLFATDMQQAQDLAKQYAGAISGIKTDRLAVATAKLGVEQARQAVAQSNAAAGSLAYRSLVNQLAQAQDNYRTALGRVRDDEASLESIRAKQAANQQRRSQDEINALKQVDLVIRQAIGKRVAFPQENEAAGIRLADLRTLSLKDQAKVAAQVAGALRTISEQEAKAGHPFRARQTEDLELILRSLKRITPKELGAIEIGFKTDNARRGLELVLAEIGRLRLGGHAAVAQLDALRRGLNFAGDAGLAARQRLIEQFAATIGHLPKQHVTELILRAPNLRAAAAAFADGLEHAAGSVARFRAGLKGEADAIKAANPAVAARLLLLRALAKEIGGIPKQHVTDLVFHSSSLAGAIGSVVAALEKTKQFAGKGGREAAAAFAVNFLRQLEQSGLAAGLADKVKAAVAQVAGIAGELSVTALKGLLKDVNASIKKIDVTVATAEQNVHDAAIRVADANRALADAISTGQQRIRDAVVSANKNLFDIGSTISDMLGQFLDAQKKASGAADISTAEFNRLRAQIIAGKGGPATLQAAQEVASQINRSQAQSSDTEKAKETAKRRISDLIVEFEKGQITIKQLVAGTSKILASLGFNYKKAGSTMGLAFVDGFKAEIAGLAQQAKLIAETPSRRRRGAEAAALGPTIVNPIQTIREVTQAVNKARERVAKAVEEQGKSLARLHVLTAKLVPLDERRNQLLKDIRDKIGTAAAAKPPTPSPTTARQAAPGVAPASRGQARFAVTVEIAPQLQQALRAKSGSALARSLGIDLAVESRQLGLAIPRGIILGLEEGKHSAFEHFRRWLVAHHLVAKKTYRTGSPSLLMRELGLDLGHGLALGLDASAPAADRSARLVAERVARSVREVLAAARSVIAERGLPQVAVAQRVLLTREFSLRGSLRDFLNRMERLPLTLAAATIRQAVDLVRSLRERFAPRDLLAGASGLPVSLPARTISQAVLLTQKLVPQGNLAELARRHAEAATSDSHARFNLPLRFHVETRTEEAAKRVHDFYVRENGRYIHTVVTADTAAAAKELSRLVEPRATRIVCSADTRPFKRELAELRAHPLVVPVRSAAGRVPVTAQTARSIIQPVLSRDLAQVVEHGFEAETLVGRQMVSELRANRSTTARGDERLLTEAKRQTTVLREMLADKRRRPPHVKPSHAPGAGSQHARESALLRLTP